MKCKTVQKELPAYREGSLSETDAGAIKEHLDVCPHCRREYDSLDRLVKMTRSGLRSEEDRIRDLAPSVTSRVKAKRSPVRPAHSYLRWGFGISGALAAVMLLFLFMPGPRVGATPQEDFEKAVKVYDDAFIAGGETREERIRQSLDLFEKFLSTYSQDREFGSSASLFLADCYRQIGKYQEAVSIYRSVADGSEPDPDSKADALGSLVNVLMEDLKDLDAAESELNRLIGRKNPANVPIQPCIAIGDRYSETDAWKAHRWYMAAYNSSGEGSAQKNAAYRKAQDLIGRLWQESYVTDWWIIGPFNDVGNYNFSYTYPPEKEINQAQSYDGANGKVGWKRITKPLEPMQIGHVNLQALLEPDQRTAAYTLTYLWASKEEPVTFTFGYDDSFRIWVNDKIVYSKQSIQDAFPDNFQIGNVILEKGWNKILLKSCNAEGEWGFYFRAVDSEGFPVSPERFSPVKKEKAGL